MRSYIYQKGGLTEGSKKHLSSVEQKMYQTALKSGNSKAISYLEEKISKGVHNANLERNQEIENLAEKQGDEFSTRQRLERRAENEGTSPFGMTNRQAQQSALLPKQKLTNQTLGNSNVPNTPDKLDRAMENRNLTNFAVDMIPGIGDIKGFYEALKDKNTAGVALASIGLIPAGDVFKPIIKKYANNTEMFTDFLKQAEEQGIKVDRNSKLYKQIQDEIPGAKEYYKQIEVSYEELADGLYLSTKSEQAQKGLADSKVQDMVYHGTKRVSPVFNPEKTRLANEYGDITGQKGNYFTDKKEIAEGYSQMMSGSDIRDEGWGYVANDLNVDSKTPIDVVKFKKYIADQGWVGNWEDKLKEFKNYLSSKETVMPVFLSFKTPTGYNALGLPKDYNKIVANTKKIFQ